MACEARHALSGSRSGRVPCAHARPAPVLPSLCAFVVLRALCGEKTLAVLRALARPKSAPICEICVAPTLAVFVYLRGSSCSS